jgi:hypothetical protein
MQPLDKSLRYRDFSVPHESLRRYLLTHGWKVNSLPSAAAPTSATPMEAIFMKGRIPEQRGFEIFIFNEEGFGEVELVVPRGRFRADFERRLQDIFETLSEVEDRDAAAIVADVRSIGFDIIRSRIPDELVYEETIQLVSATSFLSGIKSLLASAATTEITPDPYFLRVKKDGTDYAEKCRFGHTFKGSFGFTIESPVVPNTEPVFDMGLAEQSLPFERRVIQRLATGVMAISRAVESRDIAPLVNLKSINFSANMLEQFADIVEETSYGGLGFGFSFSPEWSAPPEFRTTKEFMIAAPHVEVARTAAKTLRARPLPRPEQVFGRIIRLQNQSDPTDMFAETSDGEVIIQWASEELGDTHVRVRLKPNDYLLALEAHGTGKPVRVGGTLQQQGRKWLLTGSTGFSISS